MVDMIRHMIYGKPTANALMAKWALFRSIDGGRNLRVMCDLTKHGDELLVKSQTRSQGFYYLS
jgi:hypothetical protein